MLLPVFELPRPSLILPSLYAIDTHHEPIDGYLCEYEIHFLRVSSLESGKLELDECAALSTSVTLYVDILTDARSFDR